MALKKLQNAYINGNKIELSWAVPLEHFQYNIRTHNGKVDNREPTIEQAGQENAMSRQDANIGLRYTCESPCSSSNMRPPNYAYDVPKADTLSPAQLELICNRYKWGQPIYTFHHESMNLWRCRVEFPPQLPLSIAPFYTKPCISQHIAHQEAAAMAWLIIKKNILRTDLVQEPLPAPPLYSPVPPTRADTSSQSCWCCIAPSLCDKHNIFQFDADAN